MPTNEMPTNERWCRHCGRMVRNIGSASTCEVCDALGSQEPGRLAIGGHVIALQNTWGRHGDLHELRAKNTMSYCEAADELHEAIAADMAACAWRPRPPTVEEIAAHHEANAIDMGGTIVSLWVALRPSDGIPVICGYRGINAEDWLEWWAGAEDERTGQQWRPMCLDHLICEWQSTKSEEIGHG